MDLTLLAPAMVRAQNLASLDPVPADPLRLLHLVAPLALDLALAWVPAALSYLLSGRLLAPNPAALTPAALQGLPALSVPLAPLQAAAN